MVSRAKGLAIPVSANTAGGAKTVSGSQQLRKLLALAFGEGDDNNPFQDIGVANDIIFQLQSKNLTGEVREKVKDVIRTFDGRVKLTPELPVRLERNEEGELEVIVRFFDPETNEEDEFRTKFTR